MVQNTQATFQKRPPFGGLFSFSSREKNKQDLFHHRALQGISLLAIFLIVIVFLVLVQASWPAMKEFGLSFIYTEAWNPSRESYGALSFIFGTLVTSFLGLMFSAPLSIGLALFLSEVCPDGIKKVIRFVVEMLAAIPSIVFGLWALFFLSPIIRDEVSPFIQKTLGLENFFLFSGPSFGIGILSASVILAIMITPSITAICLEVFKTVSFDLKHAALALGATRWEMIRLSVLGPSVKGIVGAMALGLGRALGETMAVAMVIGNKASIVTSIFSPSATMASAIANEYAESSSDLHLSALTYLGLVLFLITLGLNALIRWWIWQLGRKRL